MFRSTTLFLPSLAILLGISSFHTAQAQNSVTANIGSQYLSPPGKYQWKGYGTLAFSPANPTMVTFEVKLYKSATVNLPE